MLRSHVNNLSFISIDKIHHNTIIYYDNYRIGVMGTQDRLCNSTSQGPDSCLLLCCGRGFQRVIEHVEEDCNCKFVWCCQVKCDKCKRYVTNDICN